MGVAGKQAVTAAYKSNSFFNGFLQGYNTMDALAGLAFGVTVVTAVRQLGKTKPSSNAKVTAKAGVFATAAIGLIYLGLIWLGSTTLSTYKVSADGGVAFNQLVTYYLVFRSRLAGLADCHMFDNCRWIGCRLCSGFPQSFFKGQLPWLVRIHVSASFGTPTLVLIPSSNGHHQCWCSSIHLRWPDLATSSHHCLTVIIGLLGCWVHDCSSSAGYGCSIPPVVSQRALVKHRCFPTTVPFKFQDGLVVPRCRCRAWLGLHFLRHLTSKSCFFRK